MLPCGCPIVRKHVAFCNLIELAHMIYLPHLPLILFQMVSLIVKKI